MSSEIYTTAPATVGATVVLAGSWWLWSRTGDVRTAGDLAAMAALGGFVGAGSLAGLFVSSTVGMFRFAIGMQGVVLVPALAVGAWALHGSPRYGPLGVCWTVLASGLLLTAVGTFAGGRLLRGRSPPDAS